MPIEMIREKLLPATRLSDEIPVPIGDTRIGGDRDMTNAAAVEPTIEKTTENATTDETRATKGGPKDDVREIGTGKEEIVIEKTRKRIEENGLA